MMLSVQDVLQPEIVNVNGCRYRKTPYRILYNDSHHYEQQNNEAYIEEDLYYDDEPVTCEREFDNVKKSSNGYVGTIEDIPSFYFKFIVGKSGFTKNKIENETKTNVTLPPKGVDGNIVINGKARSNVIAALNRVSTLIELRKLDQPAKHFLAIQLNSTDDCAQRLHEFKKQVLAMKSRGVDDRIFQFPERLHLTLCMLIFLNEDELTKSLNKMSELVRDVKQKHFGEDNRIKLHLHGIEYMNDDPSEVDVLYAKVETLNENKNQRCLQEFVDEVVELFVSSGHVCKQNDHVKLHATLMNTKFRVERNSTQKSFDARPILKTLNNFDFGNFEIDHLDIAVRGNFDGNGHYVSGGKLLFI